MNSYNRIILESSIGIGNSADTLIYEDQLNTISITQIEKELGIDSIWKDIIHVDRNLIYTPGKKYRYSLEQQVDDDTCIQIAKLNYTFVKNDYTFLIYVLSFLCNFLYAFLCVLTHFLYISACTHHANIVASVRARITLIWSHQFGNPIKLCTHPIRFPGASQSNVKPTNN